MAQLGQDEKEAGNAVVTMNAATGQDFNKVGEKYAFTFGVNNDKQELKLEVQNKNSKQLFRKVLTKSSLQEAGFNSQLSLSNVKKMLQLACDNEQSLALTIS